MGNYLDEMPGHRIHLTNMGDKSSRPNAFRWRPPLYVAACTFSVLVLLAISSAELGKLVYLFIAIPIVSFILLLLVVLRKGRRLSALSMLIAYWVVSAAVVANYMAVRDTARWLLWSKGYKAAVLAQPRSAATLQHVEWDGWGYALAGEDVVYLVFDPDNALAGEGRHVAGKLTGLPCEVSRTRRLETHWYAVTFYTDTDWEHCS
jgi:hypothetical protein